MLADADFADAKPSPEAMPDKVGGLGGSMFLPPDFPELRLFALLKSRIGRPNGPLTFFLERQEGDPDAMFKWDFLFVPCGNLKLQIIRGVGGIEIWWWGEQSTESEILAYLRNNIAKHHRAIDDTIKGLELHTLILNPYVRHRSIANLALEQLNQVNPVRPPPVMGDVEQIVSDDFSAKFTAFMNDVDRQASLMMLLVIESAFMAESYLNMILALLVRQEIRSVKPILTETLMRKWRNKIERLHVDCRQIPEAANMSDPRVTNAKRMFDIRNRIAHSYPDKDEMAVGKMWFYKCFPVLEKADAFGNFAIALHNQLPSPDEARFCKNAADALIVFLTEMIDPAHRDTIRIVTETNPLGYNETKGIYSVPFGESVVISVTTRRAAPTSDGTGSTLTPEIETDERLGECVGD
ncbi:MAG: hypothetical protein HY290_04055 [Planctomycetia bacterium]|nr:hypothetical protein [Planctomycetia bacterium]